MGFKVGVTQSMVMVSRGEYVSGNDATLDIIILLLESRGKTPTQFVEEMLPIIANRATALKAQQVVFERNLCAK